MIEVTHHNALEVGKAAEHIVCAHVILQGYSAYLSDQGLPYDVVIDAGGRLLKVQVRATAKVKDVSPGRDSADLKYSFSVRRRGNGGSQRLRDKDCDLVALVALDCMEVAFLPLADCGQTVQLFPKGKIFRARYPRRKGRIDQYSLVDALAAMKDPSRTLFKDENRVNYRGRYGSLSSFAAERELPPSAVIGRVQRGWSIEDALETPLMRPGQKRA